MDNADLNYQIQKLSFEFGCSLPTFVGSPKDQKDSTRREIWRSELSKYSLGVLSRAVQYLCANHTARTVTLAHVKEACDRHKINVTHSSNDHPPTIEVGRFQHSEDLDRIKFQTGDLCWSIFERRPKQ